MVTGNVGQEGPKSNIIKTPTAGLLVNYVHPPLEKWLDCAHGRVVFVQVLLLCI